MKKIELCYSEFECTNYTQNLDCICDDCKNREPRTIDKDYDNFVIMLCKHYPQEYDISKSSVLKGILLYNKINTKYEICLIQRFNNSVEVTLFQITNRTLESINKEDLFHALTFIVKDELDVKKLLKLLK